MQVRTGILTIAAVAALAMTGPAQNQPAKQEPGKEIKHVPVKQTSPASGVEMYKSYCAVCHGLDGKGNGPAAPALKVPPTDLTTMSAKNGGKYPSMRVASILRGEEALAAHGTKDMPIWGNLFWNLSSGHEGEVQQRISNLNKYLETQQKK
ncbi:MAG TPA: cytochrome c [Terriglobales bacterium]|nr:cytochrome c [Terriglobales bacterium]